MTVSEFEANHIPEEDMAKMLRKEICSMRSDRARGKDHPPFIKIGIKVFYPRAEFEKWLKSRKLHVQVAGRR